jgi:hypothetical protein
MIRIGSANYDNLPNLVSQTKFDTLRYTLVGSADYTVAPVIASAWKWTLSISASGSGIGGGVSAGGLDTLRASFALFAPVTIVTDEAVTATAVFNKLTIAKQLNPTWYEYSVELTRIS